ncbi:hypothetical protein SAMN05216551_102392 [Chitinasiproducens palmae]|uniref:Uncharacterized protein n=1 Tax=Chitinasiproducens palmae TaxID=1770053 RepID=A0A1H2PL90_9BURK|nr:hypothetical protein SAMN05216551_102392 [Chitinasiproducens palmae]
MPALAKCACVAPASSHAAARNAPIAVVARRPRWPLSFQLAHGRRRFDATRSKTATVSSRPPRKSGQHPIARSDISIAPASRFAFSLLRLRLELVQGRGVEYRLRRQPLSLLFSVPALSAALCRPVMPRTLPSGRYVASDIRDLRLSSAGFSPAAAAPAPRMISSRLHRFISAVLLWNGVSPATVPNATRRAISWPTSVQTPPARTPS